MFNVIFDKLMSVKLSGMAEGLKEQSVNRAYRELSFDERFGMLVDKEIIYRENRRLKTLLSKAHFRYPNACVEDIDFRARRRLEKQFILKLSQNEWIRDSYNIIITGSTGAGKTYIACALGNGACRAGIRTCYVRLPRLLQEMKISRADGSYIKLLKILSRVKLLIVDDWGLSPLSDTERKDFLEIMEDRHNVRSTIISSQIPVEKWHDFIGEPTIADAICDRLVHNAYNIRLKGESMRKLCSKMPGKQPEI